MSSEYGVKYQLLMAGHWLLLQIGRGGNWVMTKLGF